MLQKIIFQFLNAHIDKSRPLLLALSGGVDSMSLFHLTNLWRKKEHGDLAIVHVDHGWRTESAQEAETLIQLAAKEGVACYHKAITAGDLSGNLECASRDARYVFFQEVARKIKAQGVLLAHTRDDQIETVFKRILEGAHLQYLSGMLPISENNGLILFRPLLEVAKEELLQYAKVAEFSFFEDPTNRDPAFLRARLREIIFPFLKQHFGKEFYSGIASIASEAALLRSCYRSRIGVIMDAAIENDLGFYFDLTSHSFLSFEWLQLMLRIQERTGLVLSREQLRLAVVFLMQKTANKWLHVKKGSFYFDRGRLFMLFKMPAEIPYGHVLKKGTQYIGPYEFTIDECEANEFSLQPAANHFLDLFCGKCLSYLPLGDYVILKPSGSLIKFRSAKSNRNLFRCLGDEKIPRFFLSLAPLIGKDRMVYEDFITGSLPDLMQGRCLRVNIIRKSFEKCSHH